MNEPGEPNFLLTREYRRFAEFCDACRRYRYIGLCHGAPGVGKTLSARYYANWDRLESLGPRSFASEEDLAEVLGSTTAVYTPSVVNTPHQIELEVGMLRSHLQGILEEPLRRKQKARLAEIRGRYKQDTQEVIDDPDWIFGPIPKTIRRPDPTKLIV